MDITRTKTVVKRPVRAVPAVKATPPNPPVRAASKPLKTPKVSRRRRKSQLRKAALRYGIVFLNFLIVGFAAYAAIVYSGSSSTSYGVYSTSAQEAANPLDKMTATDIAANIALMVWAPETEAIISDSNIIQRKIDSAAAADQNNAVMLPQIVSADVKTKEDIIEYTVQSGDTLLSLATKFGVTSNSIRWSNNLDGFTLDPGTKLLIPPINGIVHQVAPAETADSLARKYSSRADRILVFNDAEVGGLQVGDLIVVPDGEIQTVVGFRPILSHEYTFITRYTGYNPGVFATLYDRGWCTDWAAYRSSQLGNTISQQGTWGDAVRWDTNAKAAGYYVGPIPKVGAVLQIDSGWYGHVGVVEEVSEDKTMIKYSDMNGLAGWGNAAVTKSWVPASGYDFIYR